MNSQDFSTINMETLMNVCNVTYQSGKKFHLSTTLLEEKQIFCRITNTVLT